MFKEINPTSQQIKTVNPGNNATQLNTKSKMQYLTFNRLMAEARAKKKINALKLTDREFKKFASHTHGNIYTQKEFIKMFEQGNKLNPGIDVLRIIETPEDKTVTKLTKDTIYDHPTKRSIKVLDCSSDGTYAVMCFTSAPHRGTTTFDMEGKELALFMRGYKKRKKK